MRLLHCCGQFGVRLGGTERQARAVCGALAARGHQVSVLARRGAPPLPDVPGVTVADAIRALDRGRCFGVTYTASATLALLRRAGAADCLHAYHLYLDAAAALLAGRVRRRPVLAKMAGAGPGGDLDRLRHTAGGDRLLKSFRGLDAVIAPSATCRSELLAAGFPEDRVHVIPNGVDLARFHPGAVEEPGAGPADEGGPAVVYVGRLIEAKGVLDLLEAWPRVLCGAPGARLILLGSGPLEETLRRRVRAIAPDGSVRLAGEVPDVRPYLRRAAGFVLPSWAEGLPNSLLEAMAMGLACVATEIGPVRDAVECGRDGLLVPAKAPERLAAALTAILTQPDLRGRLGQAARKRAEAEFSLEGSVDRLETLYRALVARREGRA
jgi:glycosyltransferase involved in cell wall biosynthesis